MSRSTGLVTVVVTVALLSWTGTAICQEDPPSVGPSDALVMQPMDQESFGGNYQTLVIPAAEFTPQGDVQYQYAGAGYIFRTGGTKNTFWAPVMLPAGAHISTSNLYLYDTNASANITLTWGAYGFPLSHDPYYHEFLSVTKDTDAGYTYQLFVPNTVITYYADLDGANGTEAIGYRLTVQLPATDNSLRFGGVELSWARTISPAPATATFPDVPTTYWAFQYVEALAASGITQGMPDGNFHPRDPVTRAQMATFLARALGLHWN